ncbi:MAG: type II toxin-antitoxin system VapC family toxin [Coriobacteriia bacterium]
MTERRMAVLDASVGVKWFKNEPGSADARRVLAEHRDNATHIIVPALFVHEVVASAVKRDVADGESVWRLLRESNLTVVPLDDAFASAAFDQCRLLGCSFCDALAPALAMMLDAPLYSADKRTHERFPGVVLFG